MTAVRRAQLIRSAVWVSLAVVAMLTAFVSASTDSGVRRIAAITSGEQPAAPRGAKDVGLASRQFDQDAEQRRVNEAIRSLATDRDRLLARLNTLERSLDDATGSIGPASPIPTSGSATRAAAGCGGASHDSAIAAPAAKRAGHGFRPRPLRGLASEPRRGRTSCDRCAGVDRVCRDQDRVRDRSRRQRHRRRREGDVGGAQGRAAGIARRLAPRRVDPRGAAGRDRAQADRRPARQCERRGAAARRSPPRARPASRPCSTASGSRCSNQAGSAVSTRRAQ